MKDSKAIKKSLIEQIYDELVTRLENEEGFDDELIKKIKELSTLGELKKYAQLQSLLKTKGGAL